MASVNKVILIGNLGANPELKYLPSGQAVCEMRIATNESFTDRNGQRQDRTEWHRVVVWGKQAENCSQYLSKGRSCYIEGRLQTRSWDDKDGNKRYTTEIVADRVQFLGGGQGMGQGQGMPDEGAPRPARPAGSGYQGAGPSQGQRRGGGGGGGGMQTPPPPSEPPDYGSSFNDGGTDDDIPF